MYINSNIDVYVACRVVHFEMECLNKFISLDAKEKVKGETYILDMGKSSWRFSRYI